MMDAQKGGLGQEPGYPLWRPPEQKPSLLISTVPWAWNAFPLGSCNPLGLSVSRSHVFLSLQLSNSLFVGLQ